MLQPVRAAAFTGCTHRDFVPCISFKRSCRRHTAQAAQTAQTAVAPISPQPSPLDPSTGYGAREDVDIGHVPDHFFDLLHTVTAAYKSVCGNRLVGVYLRGSLPRGLFISGISDVDTFGVVLSPADAPASAQPAAAAAATVAVAGGIAAAAVAAAGHAPAAAPSTTNSRSSSRSASSNSGSSSSAWPAVDTRSPQELQQAVAQLCEAAVQAHKHLGYTKVEFKVLQVTQGSPAAAALQGMLLADSNRSSSNSSLCNSSSTSSSSRHASSAMRPSMVACIPQAFQLKVQSVRLSGLDLPLLLPANAALPPDCEVLPGLAADVEAARAAAQGAAAAGSAAAGQEGRQGGGVELEVQVRAAKWVLKRLLRGAFELAQDRAGCYTRDLYWCAQAAKQHLPQLQQQLSWGPQQQQQRTLQQQQERQQQQQQHNQQQEERLQQEQEGKLQQLTQASWDLVDLLLPKLEVLFLKSMLLEEPGWLTQHQGRPVPATPAVAATQQQAQQQQQQVQQQEQTQQAPQMLRQRQERKGLQQRQERKGLQQQDPQVQPAAVQQQQQQEHQQSPGLASQLLTAFQRLLHPQGTAAVAAAAANTPWRSASGAAGSMVGRAPITQVVGAAPPAVQVPVVGAVAADDWQQPDQQAAAAAAVREILGSSSSGSSSSRAAHTRPQQQPPQQQQQGHDQPQQQFAAATGEVLFELLDSCPQPVVLKGAASSWPAVQQQWDLEWLAQQGQGFRGKVRVAPSLQFPFVEPQLLELLLKLRGASSAPSLLTDMTAGEFVRRLQPNCPLPHIAYSPSEYHYLQADLPPHLQQQQHLQQLLQAFAGAPIGATDQMRGMPLLQAQQQQELSFVLTQQPRLWVSPAGAVSPLHFDKSHSFLVQVTGVKRMLFFSPDQLHRLYFYPDTHILRRRSRVNLSAPNLGRFPLFAGAAALEAVLEAGDIVCFPSFWGHYTESLGQGQAAAGGGAREPAGCCMSITFRCQAAKPAQVA